MALFKIFKGNDSTKLDEMPLVDGYAYYNTNNTNFYIDAFYPATADDLDIYNSNTGIRNEDNNNLITITVDNKQYVFNDADQNNILILSRAPINSNAIISVSTGIVKYSEVTPDGSNDIDVKAFQFTHNNGVLGYLEIPSPVLSSISNSIAFYEDNQGTFSGGDSDFQIDTTSGAKTLRVPKITLSTTAVMQYDNTLQAIEFAFI